jgi:hypothetical protein
VGEALDRRHPSGHINFVHVRVLTDGRDCIVDAQQMSCDVVGAHLKNDRHLPVSQSVLVDPDGTGRAPIARAEAVRSNLKEAGYSDVWTIGFLTSPDHPSPDP